MTRPILITGGGTGGHLFPMMAIAEALQRDGLRPDELLFVGSRRGQDRELLATTGVRAIYLLGRGIERSLSPRKLLRTTVAVAGLMVGTARSLALMVIRRPRVVVSLGGYASLACDLAAVITMVPLVLVDLDATPGATHRLVRRRARRLCTAFFDDDVRATWTGAPVRDALLSLDRSGAKMNAASANNTRWSLVVMTGSLGARSVNDVVVQLAAQWRHRDDLCVTHVTGRRDVLALQAAWRARGDDQLIYRQVPFADMVPLWATADVAICRAGAMTVAELTTLGIPSVLVPLPHAPGDHQATNAAAVAAAGGAVVLLEEEMTVESLGAIVASLLAHPERLTKMSEGARRLAHPEAAHAISAVIREVAQ